MIYAYCRVSTQKQNLERQEHNILAKYPDAVIFKEKYTGATVNRPVFDKLINKVKKGDVVVFDSVSRFSRNAEEAMILYKDLFEKEIELEFLKEPYVNTNVFRSAINSQINIEINTNNKAVDSYFKDNLTAINNLIINLASQQIEIAFAQAEKELIDIRQRIKEGIRESDKQSGIAKGTKLTTKKGNEVKQAILKYSNDFEGSLSDIDVIRLIGCAKNTYYKYKKELFNKKI